MKTFRGRAFFFFKFLLSSALVCLIVSKIGFTEFAASLKSVNLHFIPALFYAFLFTYLKMLKWHALVETAAGKGTSQADAGKSYLVGLACGLLTPGRVGEIARIVFLENHNKSFIAYLVVVDRVLDLAVVLFLSLAGLVYFSNPAVVAAVAGVSAMLLMMIFFPACPLRRLQHLLERSGKFTTTWTKLAFVATRMTAVSMIEKWRLLGITFLSYGIVIMQFYHLLNNYHHGGLGLAVRVQPLIMLTNILPFTIGGLGVREGTAIVLLSSFGVPQAAAASSAFMLFLMNVAFPGVIGALLLVQRRGRTTGAKAGGSD